MAASSPPNYYLLGLDVGDVRIGMAVASNIAKVANPIETIARSDDVVDRIKQTIVREQAKIVVVGLPRNMDGQETKQTASIREFAKLLQESLDNEVIMVDESLSSKRADLFLANQKNPKPAQDSVAACFILDEYFDTMETR